ncbi:MAG TPA: YciI family protein [Candidatus Dormibacteraeota bacterium]
MKYMLLICDDPSTRPADGAEGQKVMAEYGAYTQAIMDSKELVAGDRLRGVDSATSVRVRAGKTSALDGPFAETKEHLGGYYIVDVTDLDRAIELAARIPAARTGVVEVRPIWELGAE